MIDNIKITDNDIKNAVNKHAADIKAFREEFSLHFPEDDDTAKQTTLSPKGS